MVRHLLIRMKNGRAARPKHVVSEMTKVAGKAGIDMITNLANHIIAERLIPKKWGLYTIVNCYKRNRPQEEETIRD